VLNAAFAKFKTKDLGAKYDLMYDILPMIETNLGTMEILDAALNVFTMDTAGLMHITFPIEGLHRNSKINGSFVYLCDLPASAWAMHEFIFENAEEPDEAKVLRPGASLPPRTPSPTLPAEGEFPGFVDPFAPTDQGTQIFIPEYTPEESPFGFAPVE